MSFKSTVYVRIPKNGILKFNWSIVKDQNVSFFRFDYLRNNDDPIIISSEDENGLIEIPVKKYDIFCLELSVAKIDNLNGGIKLLLNNFSFNGDFFETDSVCGSTLIYFNSKKGKDMIRIQVGPTCITNHNIDKYIISFNVCGLYNLPK
jgi:hypothetical protein